jgi:hypothetical protein
MLPDCNFLCYIVAIYTCSMETTDLKSKIGIAKMSLDQVVKILDKQLANDYYLLFTKALHPRLRGCCTSLLGANHYD